MKLNEDQLRKYVRNEVRSIMNDSSTSNDNESEVRSAIREAVREVISETSDEKGRLDEAVMGMTGMPATNPANSFTRSNDGSENFSYDPNAVSQMAQRDRKASRSNNSGMTRSYSDYSGEKVSTGGDDVKTGYEGGSGSRIIFENQRNNDRVSLWIEGNQLVCEYKSKENGTQKTKLSEDKTKDVIEYVLKENFRMEQNDEKKELSEEKTRKVVRNILKEEF